VSVDRSFPHRRTSSYLLSVCASSCRRRLGTVITHVVTLPPLGDARAYNPCPSPQIKYDEVPPATADTPMAANMIPANAWRA
jgi:hypothetical protein